MKFIIRNIGVSEKYFDVRVEIDSAKLDLGWLDEKQRTSLAQTLREAADELCPDEVPYSELEAAWNREQEREGA